MKINEYLLAILVTAIWGWNFSIIKLGLGTLDPFMLAGLRFLFCALPLIFFVQKPNTSLKAMIFYGVLFGTGVWGMVNVGVYLGVSAGVASLLLQFSAFFTIIFGVLFFKEKVGMPQLFGFSVAMLGLMIVLNLTDGSISYAGIAFVLFGALCWSLTNVVVKKVKPNNVFSFLVWSCLFASFPLFVLGYFVNGGDALVQMSQNIDAMTVFSIFFQIYPATLFSFWIWSSLMKKHPISSVAPLSLLVPLFGLMGSMVIFDEALNVDKMAAFGLILSGLIIGMFGSKFYRLLVPATNKV
ncbi:EamA family transporter [Pseudoalteromonas fenneropenaei]|uniref:EamA family transporter n=1 Tax=Pseudoalteromonas fenneropenaei TaxID=1737459 RepID=A0ABV7CP26_9GAMM